MAKWIPERPEPKATHPPKISGAECDRQRLRARESPESRRQRRVRELNLRLADLYGRMVSSMYSYSALSEKLHALDSGNTRYASAARSMAHHPPFALSWIPWFSFLIDLTIFTPIVHFGLSLSGDPASPTNFTSIASLGGSFIAAAVWSFLGWQGVGRILHKVESATESIWAVVIATAYTLALPTAAFSVLNEMESPLALRLAGAAIALVSSMSVFLMPMIDDARDYRRFLSKRSRLVEELGTVRDQLISMLREFWSAFSELRSLAKPGEIELSPGMRRILDHIAQERMTDVHFIRSPRRRFPGPGGTHQTSETPRKEQTQAPSPPPPTPSPTPPENPEHQPDEPGGRNGRDRDDLDPQEELEYLRRIIRENLGRNDEI